jgi:branched-chain amino acid transport system substrate-binding protein
VFVDRITGSGSQILETIKVPIANPDFAPSLQRADPDTLLVFVAANGQTGAFARQLVKRCLDKAASSWSGPRT